mmetsp:Transcript_94874/g.255215  ORF Transcript_94874/g.255215 Transcript_94874/m.255215 type:complete len:299 (-) Transcript_94874:7-903(-)
MKATGVVLWECGVLLADYLGYARHRAGSGADGGDVEPPAWWMLHPPAPVVPSRFWSLPARGTTLELGGGCGLVAATLASLGAQVVCTDGDPAALATAARNCSGARRRGRRGPTPAGTSDPWGKVVFQQFSWGDAEASRRLVRESGPFSLIVGSDLLYGEASTAGPLIETLAAMASEPGARDAEVILAIKNRCANEAVALCAEARRRDIWDVRLAEADDFPEGYDTHFTLTGCEEGRAYNIVHLVVKKSCEQLANNSDGAGIQDLVPCRQGEEDAPRIKRPRSSEATQDSCELLSGNAL